MSTFDLFLVQFILGITCWTIIAYWVVHPWLRGKSKMESLKYLVIPQMFRHIGIGLAVPGLVALDMPHDLAIQIAAGDTITAIAFMIAFVSLNSKWKVSMPIVWLANMIGFTDVMLSVIRASINDISNQLHGAWYIPTLSVPLMIIGHVLIFVILLKKDNGK